MSDSERETQYRLLKSLIGTSTYMYSIPYVLYPILFTLYPVATGSGPGGPGSVGIGTRTLSESGTVGTWRRAQVELFCISKLINCVLESDEEFICMDFHFATGACEVMVLQGTGSRSLVC